MAKGGDIAFTFGADISPLKGGMAEASKSIRSFSGKATKELRAVANSAVKMGAAMTAAAATGLAVMAKESAEAAKEIRILSSVANTSVKDFQRFAFAAETVGIENDKLADILKDVNDRVGDFMATGGGPMADFFEKIAPKVGVTAKEFANLSGPAALQLYVDSLEKANLSQEDMTFYLEAMASDLTNLLPLLRNGGKGLGDAAKRADELGIVLDKIDIAQLENANKAFSEAEAVIKSVGMVISAELAPFLTEATNGFLDAATASGSLGEKIRGSLTTGVRIAAKLADVINGLKVVFKGVEVIAIGFGAAVANVFRGVMEGITKMTDLMLRSINVAIDALNKIPKVDIGKVDLFADSAFMNGVRNMADESTSLLTKTRDEFLEFAAMAPPSEGLETYLDRVIAKQQVLAEQTAMMLENEGLQPVDELEEDEKKKQESIDREKAYQATLLNIRKNSADASMKIIRAQWGGATAETVGAMKNILSTMSTSSKRAFKIQKAWAIADALISTYQGIAAGVKLGWPMAIPAVAWAAATGFAQLSKIRSQSFNGGGGGGGSVGGGAAASAPSMQQASPQQNQSSEPARVVVEGIEPDQLITGRALNALLQEASDNGALITVA